MPTLARGASRLLVSIILIIIFLGGGSVIAGFLYAMREEAPKRNTPELTPVVRTATLKRETITEQFIGYGSATAIRETHVASEVSGRITSFVNGIREGVAVEKGQTLVTLDNREYLRILQRAEALVAADQAGIDQLKIESEKLGEVIATAKEEVRLARAEWDRVSGLFKKKQAASKEHVFAELALQQAIRTLQGYELQASKIVPRSDQLLSSKAAREAEAARARLDMERCAITAPFGGRIKNRFVEEGDWLGPGTLVLSIVDSSAVEIAAQLPASVYGRVAVGANCRVTSESLVDTFWPGKVLRIAPAIDERARTFAAYIEVDNRRQATACVPGMFVTVEVEGRTYRDALLVPRGALRGDRVFVLEDGLARLRRAAPERVIGDRAVVSGALRVGDRIILPPLAVLADDMPVRSADLGAITADKGNRD